MIKTREEINLRMLKGVNHMLDAVITGNIAVTEEAIRAVAALGHPRIARCYSEYTLRRPDDRLRTVACKNCYEAYFYAVDVDKCPKNETRQGACMDPETAYYYARYVDKKWHELTWRSAEEREYWRRSYIDDMNIGRIKCA